MKRHTLAFCLLSALIPLAARAADIRHVAFQTNNTVLGPEINLVVFNDSDQPLTVSAYFGLKGIDPASLRQRSCYVRAAAAGFKRSDLDYWDPADGLRPYSAFEQAATSAVIAPRSFVHRYYPLGLFAAFPCEATIAIRDDNKGQETISRLQLNSPAERSFRGPGDVSVDSVVEIMENRKLILATILLKNNASKPARLRLVQKSLRGCNADIHDAVVRQGMEGGFFEIAQRSYAVVQTAVQLRGNDGGKDCRLLVELDGGEGLPANSPLRRITVPLKPSGQYIIPGQM